MHTCMQYSSLIIGLLKFITSLQKDMMLLRFLNVVQNITNFISIVAPHPT
jgi:hypothetical protein